MPPQAAPRAAPADEMATWARLLEQQAFAEVLLGIASRHAAAGVSESRSNGALMVYILPWYQREI